MKYENIKTIILILLVFISIVLTWMIWSYQPQYETLKQVETVPEVSLGGHKEIEDVIRPEKIFYHDQNTHYGMVHPSEIKKIMTDMKSWDFSKFRNVSNRNENLTDFIQRNGHIEIVFSDSIPLEFYQTILQIEEEVRKVFFDRIIIDLNSMNNESGTVYFVSLNQEEITEATVSASFISNLENNYFTKIAENEFFREYIFVPVSEHKKFLLPAEEAVMYQKSFLIEELPTEKFRDALFSDPSFVQRNYTSFGEEFTDSSKLLSVNNEASTILYVNTAEDKPTSIRLTELLQKGFDFINGHGGWTDNYQLVSADESEQTILYRMYDSYGYPIFSLNGISEILQIWGETSIHQYYRNNFAFGREIETQQVDMLPGEEAFAQLQEQDGINIEFVEDFTLGYKMEKSSEEPLIRIEPGWFYKYKGQWVELNVMNEGGEELGLE